MPIKYAEKAPSEGESDGETEEKVTVVEADELSPWPASQSFQVVGKRQTRVDGREKVTGQARYTYDVRLPGQLYARVLRSPHPHAEIVRIDTSRAEALPGVHAVISSANAPTIKWYEESKLFDTTVRFVGDEVAAVAAESEEIATDALALIDVEYRVLPFATDLEAALAPDAPTIHEDGNLIGEPKVSERGDPQQGLREAAVLIEHTYTTQTALHNSLEPHGSTAVWRGDELELWTSTQGIFAVRQELAEKLELPEHKVRVIKQYMGGGFGSKQVSWKADPLAALLAKQSGRPVQLMYTRSDENLAAGNRNATRQKVTLGAREDGTLTVIIAEIDLEVGAYQVGGEASNVSGAYQTMYRCPNLKTTQRGVYTNAGPAVAFRAPGHVEAAIALESAMDELARALKIDPIELRLRNYSTGDQDEDKPYTAVENLRACYAAVRKEFGWDSYQRPKTSGTKRRGIGFAAHDWPAGNGSPPGYAWIKLNSDGSADVIAGIQDIGTGTRTGLLQVAAEELGLPLDKIRIQIGDTANAPYGPTSAGSATQATIGPAIRTAAIDIKAQLLRAAAPLLEEEPENLQIEDGVISIKGSSEQSVTIAEVAQRIAPHMIQAQGARGANPEDKTVRTAGAQCVEVEVDIETGEVELLRVVAAHDIGRLINPLMVESQIIGGITQGIGYALSEERVVDQRFGVVLNANLEEYKVPTVADIPPITYIPLDMPDLEANPIGAKGVGEPPLIPTAPAIGNAIYDAVGVRLYHSPFKRQRLLDALKAKAETPEGAL